MNSDRRFEMIKQTILVINNESDLSAMVEDCLGNDYKIKTASSRHEGFQKAKDELPVLIVIGFIEPRGEAFRLHQYLREDRETCSIPLFIIDACPEEHSLKGWRRNEGMQMDAEGYMAGPIDPLKLYEEIEKCLTNACLKSYEMERTLGQMETALSRQMEGMAVH
jgi:response regulator RpfG family c-di-GMP phosphodiesterase